MFSLVDEMVEKGVPKVETYPACEHRFKVENEDGTKWCWICGQDIED